ncbi:hypothetical protein HAX54_048720 [Datura stramonium]|uniref:Uncharacterized protein n=1 Tax=Datura stramonium TaxID=4076 RepID=A0ABS8SUV3_DATST|nr:hypothetical protein [Datura stramonium]
MEPVVAYVFEIDLGIDSRVEHSQATEAQPSTSDTPVAPQLTLLIEHMPDMIKRAIDKALAHVRVKIHDLEHRVSEIEGIGAREALAVLKPDMSKPNLSIFDALLPEDEDFEDERVETGEEDPEDDHMVGAGLNSRAPAGEESETTETTTLAQSEEAKDS